MPQVLCDKQVKKEVENVLIEKDDLFVKYDVKYVCCLVSMNYCWSYVVTILPCFGDSLLSLS